MSLLLGLDVNKYHILEMACIVTEGNLEIVEEVSRISPSKVENFFTFVFERQTAWDNTPEHVWHFIIEKHFEMVFCSYVFCNTHMPTFAQGPNIVVHQPDEVLESMDKWCEDQHGKVRVKFVLSQEDMLPGSLLFKIHLPSLYHFSTYLYSNYFVQHVLLSSHNYTMEVCCHL